VEVARAKGSLDAGGARRMVDALVPKKETSRR
jgi:hypothetical protein